MINGFKIGQAYNDVLSNPILKDQFVSRFSFDGSGIGNSGGIRAARYLRLNTNLPANLILVTRKISHRWHNPWEDIIDYPSSTIHYWGDAKAHQTKEYDNFKGNKHLKAIWKFVLENRLSEVPPILHFSKPKKGIVQFNGLCALTNLELTWFEDQGKPVKNYRCELTILDADHVDIEWLHDRAKCDDISKLNENAPQVWKDYIKGNLRKLDIWSKSILSKEEQLPSIGSKDDEVLNKLSSLTPTQFEAVVVELFKNLPHINHKIVRTRPTADGGFDFYGKFSIPYPMHYNIEFLGEAKKFARDNAVQPKHVSRLVARLNRGQFGLFVTTSYYTKQTQREVLEDGYPVRLFSGIDLVNILRELRLVQGNSINADWLKTVTKGIL